MGRRWQSLQPLDPDCCCLLVFARQEHRHRHVLLVVGIGVVPVRLRASVAVDRLVICGVIACVVVLAINRRHVLEPHDIFDGVLVQVGGRNSFGNSGRHGTWDG